MSCCLLFLYFTLFTSSCIVFYIYILLKLREKKEKRKKKVAQKRNQPAEVTWWSREELFFYLPFWHSYCVFSASVHSIMVSFASEPLLTYLFNTTFKVRSCTTLGLTCTRNYTNTASGWASTTFKWPILRFWVCVYIFPNCNCLLSLTSFLFLFLYIYSWAKLHPMQDADEISGDPVQSKQLKKFV